MLTWDCGCARFGQVEARAVNGMAGHSIEMWDASVCPTAKRSLT